MLILDPPTTAQLPKSAQEYYDESVKAGLFEYSYVGNDLCGRRVYQKYIDGEEYGEPRALLTYAEFKKAVLKAASQCDATGIGIPRWVNPTY